MNNKINLVYDACIKIIFNNLFIILRIKLKMNRYRKFYDLPIEFESNKTKELNELDENFIEYISKSEIGSNQHFTGPFGSRQSILIKSYLKLL